MLLGSGARLLGLGLLAAALACSDSPTQPQDASTAELDLAVLTGEAVASDVKLMAGQEWGALGGSLPLMWPHPAHFDRANCARNPDSGYFVCVVTRDGLTIERSFAFRDTDGVVQSQYDPELTESVHFLTSVDGAVTRASGSAQLHYDRDLTLSGLAGTETSRRWDGSGSGMRSGTFTGQHGTRTAEISSSDAILAVVFGIPREENPWPLSGQIVLDVTATHTARSAQGDRTVTRTLTRHVEVTFNGTAIVPLVINGVEFVLNLETGEVTRAG